VYRISNWNVEQPKVGSKKTTLILRKISELNSDILVLTETSDAIDLCEKYPFSILTNSFERTPKEHWVAIWSKWPIIEKFETVDSCRTVCAKIKSPFGDIIIYGTIIPYHMAGVRGVRYGELGYKTWEYHEKDIINQSGNWNGISFRNPSTPLFIVGDFNQTRGIEKGYGTKKCRDLLTNELKKSKFECIS